MNILLEAATRYALFGWHVFPIKPGQKTPLTEHGCLDATTDANQILAWWTKWPDANVAVACGKTSGIYVVDVDVSEGVDGYKSLNKFPSLSDTVMQFTPSGGFHAFFHADDPPVNKNSFRPGIDVRGDGYYVLLPPSIHPNGKPYVWSSGLAPWEIETAEYPDCLRPVKKMVAASCPVPAVISVRQEDDTLCRASLYLAQCDAAIQGSCGHNALLWACGCMTWGYELSADQAYELLAREYNPRCMPPWDLSTQKDEKDFRRKITESIKHPPQKPRGWLLNDDSYAPAGPLTQIDVAKLITNAFPVSRFPSWDAPLPPGTTHKQLTDRFSEIHKEAVLRFLPPLKNNISFLTQPTGLFGELCAWINATAFKPQPYLTLGAALAFLGVLFGRKVKDCLGSRTNLYVMSIAPSSAGKNHAMNKIRELCMEADCLNLLGGSDIASDSAIESRVAVEPATLFLLDEVGHLLAHIKSGASKHQAQIVSLLMQLYSSASNVYLGREYADVDNQRTIVQPCLCIYGITTPDKFASGLSSSELVDGWLSRCLVFYVTDEPRKRRDVDLLAPPPKQLVSLVNSWAKRTVIKPEDAGSIGQFVVGSANGFQEAPPKQIIVPTDADAEQRFRDFDDMAEALSKKDFSLAASWLKAEENARRIALIIACSDSYDNPVVTIAAADRACQMIKKIVVDFGKHVVPEIAEGRVEIEKQRILNVIKRFGATGCTKCYLTKKTRWANARQRNDLLQDLIDGGELACEKTESGRGIRFRAVDCTLLEGSGAGDE